MNKPQLDDFEFEMYSSEMVTVAHETAGSVEEVIRISGEMLTELERTRDALHWLFSLDPMQFEIVCDAMRQFVVDDPRCFVAAVDAAMAAVDTKGLAVV